MRLGSDARIPCPMTGHPTPMIDWAKGGESISPYSWERFRTSKKYLKIANVHKEDYGEFTCKGTNGFGSEEVKINLVVIGERKKDKSKVVRDVQLGWGMLVILLRMPSRKCNKSTKMRQIQ